MQKMEGSFQIATWESKVLIKVEGFATLNNSLLFSDFTAQMVRDGCTEFIIDLAGCKGMDSTFMGVLVGIAQGDKEASGQQRSHVTIINLHDYHYKLLDNLGISQVLIIAKTPIALPNIPLQNIQEKKYDPQARIKLIKTAHQNLLSLQSQYQKEFEEFLQILEQELQQQVSQQ